MSAALAAVGTDQYSKVFVLMRSETAKALALQGTEAGFAFPQMTPTGGVIAGMPAIVSDGVLEGTLIVLDASAIAADRGSVSLEKGLHADVQMSSGGDRVNLWQNNLVCARAVRFFGAELLRADAVAVINNLAY